MQKKGKNVRDEYREAVHVLAHCINELNMGLMVGGNDSEEALENYKKRNLMKLFACMCIDSLGECYATCQATIRAEQGNGIDAISRMHQIDNGKLDEQDRAELDFYQYYFESMFHHQDYEKVHKHGQKFFEFCKNQHVSNRDKFQDGLLHFYVVSLRMQLKMFLEEFVNSKNRNKLFFQDEKRICNSGCFGYYEELRKKEFSEFVNIQMIREREKLIIVYKILRNLQNSKLPLFYEQENFGKDLAIDESIEELYDLCKKFIKLSKGIGRNYCFGEDSKEKFNHDKEQKDKYLIRINTINVGAFVCAEGLGFELYGNIEIFLKYFKNHPFIDYKMLDESAHNEYKVNSKSKILYFEDAESCFNCCCELFKNSEGKIIRVFYVGEPDEDLAYKEIAAFKTVNICFLMAYIYESIEKILDYIFNPTPIYILAPLRSASNYEFQEARFDSLLKYPDKFSAPIEVRSDGIGIVYRKDYIKDDHFHISFINDDVQNACIGIIKMHANNLYVMRGERLVRKESVHIGLVNKMYNDFAEARKAAEKKRHENCEGEASTTPSCSFFYKCLGNERDCSRGKFEAVKKLWQLFNIACEEQVLFTDECYFLQTSFVMEKYPMDGGFQICIFDRNITDFISKDCCLREVVSINKGTIVREKGEKVYMPIVDDIEKRNDVIKKLEELIKKCKDEVEMCQINNGDVSIGLIRNILEEAQTTLREVKNGDRIDFAKIEGQWIKWRQELEKIKD